MSVVLCGVPGCQLAGPAGLLAGVRRPGAGTDGRVADGNCDVVADDLSCRERVEAGLAAIERAQPVVNACTSLCPDRAFGAAGPSTGRSMARGGHCMGARGGQRPLRCLLNLPTSCSSKTR